VCQYDSLCTLHRRDALMTKSSIVADNALAAQSGEIYTKADTETDGFEPA
jgi:hypothetical protein